jgi:hypothetical protein
VVLDAEALYAFCALCCWVFAQRFFCDFFEGLVIYYGYN